MLTDKDLVLTCLSDDFEDDVRIQKLLAIGGDSLSKRKIIRALKELLDEELVYINWSISNKQDGYWYGMTEKGREYWKNIGTVKIT